MPQHLVLSHGLVLPMPMETAAVTSWARRYQVCEPRPPWKFVRARWIKMPLDRPASAPTYKLIWMVPKRSAVIYTGPSAHVLLAGLWRRGRRRTQPLHRRRLVGAARRRPCTVWRGLRAQKGLGDWPATDWIFLLCNKDSLGDWPDWSSVFHVYCIL